MAPSPVSSPLKGEEKRKAFYNPDIGVFSL
jgi:hypothetical protein